MSDTASTSSGIAARYATALFELAKEAETLPAIEQDLDALAAALEDSADFGDLISSPLYSRDEQGAAVAAISKKMNLGALVDNTLNLLAAKGRLFVLPYLISGIKDLIAEEKGEVVAEVTSAKALTKVQREKLAKTLQANLGKTVNINAAVDASLIGGLIVKVGSKMIDSSIRSKLSNLQNAMKEVG